MMNNKEDWAILLKNRIIKPYGHVNYHIFSSIWTDIKDEFPVLTDYNCWFHGTGQDINFWTDTWAGDPFIIETDLEYLHCLGINPYVKVYDLIIHDMWNIPSDWFDWFPFLQARILPIHHNTNNTDFLYWNKNEYGVLSLKDAYRFKSICFRMCLGLKPFGTTTFLLVINLGLEDNS